MEKNKQAYIISEKINVWEMVGLKYINSKEDLEALSKDELVGLAWRLINDFFVSRYTREDLEVMFFSTVELWRMIDSERQPVPEKNVLEKTFENLLIELNQRKENGQ